MQLTKSPIKIIKYSSAEEIVHAHNKGFSKRINAVDGFEVDLSEIQFGNDDFVLNDAQIIGSLNDAGFWAFADTWTNTIHVYFDERISVKTRLRVLAHEFAHLTGKPCKDPTKEEKRCDTFSDQVMNLMVLFDQVK